MTVARLEPGDVAEDVAAHRIARAVAGPNARAPEPFTGRANLYAQVSGLVQIDPAKIGAVNAIDEGITVATLNPYEPVRAGEMLATIKIIPFAVLDMAVSMAERAAPTAISVAPFAPRRVALISTETPGFKRSLLEKNRAVTADRVTALGSTLDHHAICDHSRDAVAAALKEAHGDLILIFGATANSDRADVIPAGLEHAGGKVLHSGMPVDPGNLLVLGELNGRAVIGLPGCARSPKRNGFDFVLERLCAGLPVTSKDIMGMGVGGLLKEIPVRGQPRDSLIVRSADKPNAIAAVVLAAGRSTRMGSNKLLAEIGGVPVLLLTIGALKTAGVSDIVVVTGHEREAVEAILPSEARIVFNPAYGSGMASSLRAGFSALGPNAGAAFVALGDMPAVRPEDIRAIIAGFDPAAGRGIVVPTHRDTRGHPVLFGRGYWPSILEAAGDQGALQALIDNAKSVCEVAVAHPGVVMDADTPETLHALRDMMGR